jgi:hypothetical protein
VTISLICEEHAHRSGESTLAGELALMEPRPLFGRAGLLARIALNQRQSVPGCGRSIGRQRSERGTTRPSNSFSHGARILETWLMATERQLQLDQAFRQALRELGTDVSTAFLIAAASDRTQADPAEIIEAVEAVNRGRESRDEGTGRVTISPCSSWRLERRSRRYGATCPKTFNSNCSSARSLLRTTQRENALPFSCTRSTFVRLMRSRLAPSLNPTVQEDNPPAAARCRHETCFVLR